MKGVADAKVIFAAYGYDLPENLTDFPSALFSDGYIRFFIGLAYGLERVSVDIVGVNDRCGSVAARGNFIHGCVSPVVWGGGEANPPRYPIRIR